MLYLIFLSSKAQRILKQEGFNGTIVLDTLQSSAVISDVILNMKTIMSARTVLYQELIHPVLTLSTNHESFKLQVLTQFLRKGDNG
ncbi:hypothetical protein T09_101 [Trichinella sp. T9]|nr:hypothetical protein T09_101 [Trichinella sp. T9]